MVVRQHSTASGTLSEGEGSSIQQSCCVKTQTCVCPQPRLTVVRKHSTASGTLPDGSLGSSLGGSLGAGGIGGVNAADGDLPSVMTCASCTHINLHEIQQNFPCNWLRVIRCMWSCLRDPLSPRRVHCPCWHPCVGPAWLVTTRWT